MFNANRFSKIPTKKCRRRLEKALSNRQPISKGDRHRAAIITIQSALSDLNSGYLPSSEVDGYFGSKTYSAVEQFQRDYGLVADGQVARQTLSQLDALFSGDVLRNPIGVSVHVGVDRVDPDHYGGEFALPSCENDAKKMQEIADQTGYDSVLLVNEEATVNNFTSFMRHAVTNLFDGDALMLTFSGHGSQVANTSLDAEDDNMDETLCFYDRMLIDDELYALLGQLREGVRVNLVFDSCHSGTVAKKLEFVKQDKKNYKDTMIKNLKNLNSSTTGTDRDDSSDVDTSLLPISSKSLGAALDGEKPEFTKSPRLKKDNSEDMAKFFTDLYNAENAGKSKNIEFFNGIYDRNKVLYDTVKNIVGPQEDQRLRCSVVSLSACQDSQTTPAGQVYSLFTSNISNIWSSGGYEGSNREFIRSIVNRSPADVVPAINTYGPSRARTRLYERPFMI